MRELPEFPKDVEQVSRSYKNDRQENFTVARLQSFNFSTPKQTDTGLFFYAEQKFCLFSCPASSFVAFRF